MTITLTPRKLGKTAELLEMMLFVTCAKCWCQQIQDGTKTWMAIGTIHPFVQLEASSGDSPGNALNAAYSNWKQQNA
jgi:hypothetical protein